MKRGRASRKTGISTNDAIEKWYLDLWVYITIGELATLLRDGKSVDALQDVIRCQLPLTIYCQRTRYLENLENLVTIQSRLGLNLERLIGCPDWGDAVWGSPCKMTLPKCLLVCLRERRI